MGDNVTRDCLAFENQKNYAFLGDKEKGHLWQKESSARSVSNIFLWQHPGSPPSPWSPQQLPFPDALSKPGTG